MDPSRRDRANLKDDTECLAAPHPLSWADIHSAASLPYTTSGPQPGAREGCERLRTHLEPLVILHNSTVLHDTTTPMLRSPPVKMREEKYLFAKYVFSGRYLTKGLFVCACTSRTTQQPSSSQHTTPPFTLYYLRYASGRCGSSLIFSDTVESPSGCHV